MTKEEKLLNMLMGDGASDGEIINARNMLKKMNVKLNVGENNQSEDYIRLFRKHTNLQSEYQILYSKYNSLYREYYNVMSQKMEVKEKDKYERQVKELTERLVNREMELSSKKFIIKLLCVINILLIIFISVLANKNNTLEKKQKYNIQKEISDIQKLRNDGYKQSIIKELVKLSERRMDIKMRKVINIPIERDINLSSVEFQELYEGFIRDVHKKLYGVDLKHIFVYRSFDDYEITLYYNKEVKQ